MARGDTLTPKQSKFIGLARAILREPPILCLDEPTSMMDVATEKRVMTQLATLMAGKTLILVTHRRSLMQLVDRVIVVDRGRILADGPRQKILAPRPAKILNQTAKGKHPKESADKGTVQAPKGQKPASKGKKEKSGGKTRSAANKGGSPSAKKEKAK